MARNRYGWQKRAKELARKQKNDDKIKRRQGKALEPSVTDLSGATESPAAVEEETYTELPPES
ncbi:MAG: hypothetical protein M0P73_09410 [Syntrophobacterales bacterium]|jgi:hypothetical protein|nr:hypothetical protein [Syntrophobacterales bacterium]